MRGGPVQDLRFDVLINRAIEFLGSGGREIGVGGWNIWKNYRLDYSVAIMRWNGVGCAYLRVCNS